jgi:HAD superfamily hydrolase (TIGR01509 family)
LQHQVPKYMLRDIVSNLTKGMTDCVFVASVRMHDARWHRTSQGADDKRLKAGKPVPDLFLLAARKLGFSPSNCVVFEDSPSGIRAGLASGATLHQPRPEEN